MISKQFSGNIDPRVVPIEVKGLGRWFEKEKQMVFKKLEVLEEFCEKNNYKCRFITDKEIGKSLWKKAKEIHNETYRKNI